MTISLTQPAFAPRDVDVPSDGGTIDRQDLLTDCEHPAWLAPTLTALNGLLELAPGWDSYGARAILPAAAHAALELLRQVMKDDTPEPQVVPTSRGGVQLEWHTSGIDLALDVVSGYKFRAYFADEGTGEEWEGDIGINLAPVAGWIARLSP